MLRLSINPTRLAGLLIAVVTVTAGSGSASVGPQRADDFYRGKTLRILVGSSAGGGYDREARLLARHLPRHLPGAPRVVVEDVPGAGGLVLANTFASATKPDGLTAAFFPSAVLIAQLTGSPAARFDVRRFEILGSAYAERSLCVFTTASGIGTLDQWKASRRPLKLGATSPESSTHILPAMLETFQHLPVQIISGYTGSAEIRLAMATGELDGSCLNWGAVRSYWPRREGIAIVVQAGLAPHADLPDVPVAPAIAETSDARALLGTLMDALGLAARFYAFPPGTSQERRDMLRRGLLSAMRDQAYIQDAQRSSITFDPTSGERLTTRIRELLDLPPALVDEFKRAIAR